MMRSVPWVAVGMLLFAIALSRAAPGYGSGTAMFFERFLTYMGQQ